MKQDTVKRYTPSKEKSNLANSISFELEEMKSDIGNCLYKLYYGDRYIIHKGKTLAGSLFLLQKGYGYFFAYDHKAADNRNHYYYKLYHFIKKHPDLKFRVEMILVSNSGYDLLEREQIEINKSFKDKKCLNNNIISYIPVFRESSDSYGWIGKEDVERFKEYLSNM